MLPLSDTLVLDLTQVIAGPTAGQILGDMAMSSEFWPQIRKTPLPSACLSNSL